MNKYELKKQIKKDKDNKDKDLLKRYIENLHL